jgi:hypothetical protein
MGTATPSANAGERAAEGSASRSSRDSGAAGSVISGADPLATSAGTSLVRPSRMSPSLPDPPTVDRSDRIEALLGVQRR